MGVMKESEGWAVMLGIALPVLLVLLVGLDIVTGQAWWIEYRGRFQRGGGVVSYTDPVRFAGVVSTKGGAALWLFAWFYLANRSDLERYVQPVKRLGVVMTIGGLAILIIGYVHALF